MKYQQVRIVEATQWFKPGDHPAVCPHNSMKEWGSLEQEGSVVHVKPGDYIVEKMGDYRVIRKTVFEFTHKKV